MKRQASTKRGRETLSSILDAACELFGQRGVRAVSLDEIQAASGTGRSQLYCYFSGKPDLVAEVIRRQSERLLDGQQPLLGSFATAAELRALFSRAVECYTQDGALTRCPLGSLAYELGEDDTLGRLALRDGFRAWRDQLHAGLQRIQARGELGTKAEPSAIADALLAVYEGGVLLAHTGDGCAALRCGLQIVLDAILLHPQEPASVHS